MKKAICILLAALSLLSCATPILAASPQTFSDVPQTHWAYSYIQQAASDGVVNGVGNGKFDPNGNVTCGQITAVLARMLCTDEEIQKHENGGVWYVKYKEALGEKGALNSFSGSSALTETFKHLSFPAQRYELALFLYGAATAYGMPEISDDETQSIINTIPKMQSYFVDQSNCRKAIAFCYKYGIMSGVDKAGTFNGQGLVTRAQLATTYSNLRKYITDIPTHEKGALDDSHKFDPYASLKPMFVGTSMNFKEKIAKESVGEVVFVLAHLNDDDIPDLLVTDNSGIKQSYIRAYAVSISPQAESYFTNVTYLGDFGEYGKFTYVPKGSYILSLWHGVGAVNVRFSSVDTTISKTIKEFADNEPSPPNKFLIDDKAVSKDEYLSQFNAMIQGKNFKMIDVSKGFPMTEANLSDAFDHPEKYLVEGDAWTPRRYDAY